ncbi:MAG: SUMF1/EgtB/PvdO family nonheme iron enzyme, partial [Chitinophagales bacterium]|nr:SUMF1/EgtB/PvdO family nonheme iron enzyme [Chitinophagales bacterium]
MQYLSKILIPVVGLLLMASCSGDDYKGQLLGVQSRPSWRSEIPYGMVNVPTGTLHVGNSDQDVPHALTARAKQVSILGFYMDATEITNNEYRQFEVWVKDSIAHTILQHFEEVNSDQLDGGSPNIKWDMEIDWENSEVQNQLSQMYLPKDQWVNGLKEMEFGKLVYRYDYIEWKKAAFSKHNSNRDRRQYVKTLEVDIYPDTLCWIRDFTYSYNEPMVRQYYTHPAFDDYPVVGVRWDQATAFCYWRTHIWNEYKHKQGELINDNIRLPIEHEWEYAARGGKKLAPYPWGGPYTRNSKGCLLANFKPGRG